MTCKVKYGIMLANIIPVHLVSACTAESQALESAGGTMSACGHGIMLTNIIPVHLVSAFTAESNGQCPACPAIQENMKKE